LFRPLEEEDVEIEDENEELSAWVAVFLVYSPGGATCGDTGAKRLL
jgi:hypothetical protein